MVDRRVVETRPGYSTTYWEFGDPNGKAVVALHGTPTSGRLFGLWNEAAGDQGVRLIAPDRSGIGGTTFVGATSVAESAGAVHDFVRALQIDCWVVLGQSGGGPFSLACARNSADGLVGAVVVSGIGEIADWAPLEGVERDLIRVMTEQESTIDAEYATLAAAVRDDPAAAFDLLFPEATAEMAVYLVKRYGSIAAFVVTLCGDAFEQGPAGVLADYRALTQPWGFDLADITIPVRVMHGDADEAVPASHAIALKARLSNATLQWWPGTGHLIGDKFVDAITTAAELFGT